MAHKFPPYKIRNNEVVDYEDFNQDLFAVVDEVAGNLNEHNWATNATRPSGAEDTQHMAEGVAHRVHKAKPGSPVDPQASYNDAANFKVPVTGTWVAVDNATITINKPDSIVWVMAFFQLRCNSATSGGLFALSLDGTVIPETMLGSAELDQEKRTSTSSGTIHRLDLPLCIDLVVPLPEGNHTNSLVARAPYSTARNLIYIGQREISVLELVR